MSPVSQNQFHSSLGVKFTPDQIVAEIIRYMKDDDKRRYKIIIGTDSEAALNNVDFVTAIVIHRVGNGGRYFWRRILANRFATLRDRIWHEVLMSLDVAKDFVGLLQEQSEMPAFDFEVHIDVGENGATRDMIQELVGVVRANNFEAKTKPDSYAASKVADRHTK